jgi:hypothetical protein
MNGRRIQRILKAIEKGDLSVGEAAGILQRLSYSDLGCAKVDIDRENRCGIPEAIFCQGKNAEQVKTIARRMLTNQVNVLATRATEEMYQAVREVAGDAVWTPLARTITVRRWPRHEPIGEIVVVCAGTADLPVAEEARMTAEFLNNRVHAVRDVGVAGLHRLLHNVPRLVKARVVIVVAGMEGALPSVVSGMVPCPVVAVPTSVGYGANFQGLAPLLTMLNSCAAGVAVVNIDNGFGAACVASLINHTGGHEG